MKRVGIHLTCHSEKETRRWWDYCCAVRVQHRWSQSLLHILNRCTVFGPEM